MQDDLKCVPRQPTEHMVEEMTIIAKCMLEAAGKIDVGLIYETGVQAADEAAEALARHQAEIAELDKTRKLLNRRCTDHEYMIGALVSMLGPNALQVWQGWQESGVQRVHHSWGPDAGKMTGEERAAVLLAWERAPRELIHDVDEMLAGRPEKRSVHDIVAEVEARTALAQKETPDE